MVYNIKNNYKSFLTIKDNRLNPRSYFIPFSNKIKCDEAVYINSRATSDRVCVLNGKWDFVFFENEKDVPSHFSFNNANVEKIMVPSSWQMKGYDISVFENCSYKSNFVPPKLPSKITYNFANQNINTYNSVGIYRRIIDIKRLDKVYILTFFGVSSCFDVYINGKYAGYNEGSHNKAEFDISEHLNVGFNELVVVVHKWCNGSYLDCKDMYNNSGIFRDVILTTNNKTFLWDFDFSYKEKNDLGDYLVNIKTNVKNFKNHKIRVSFEDNKKVLYENIVDLNNEDENFEFEGNFKEYNPEIPKLYDLYISLIEKDLVVECVRKKVGFKRINISEGVFYYNDKAIKLKGINYLPINLDRGMSLNYENMINDVTLMKEYNINAIKISKYGIDPQFLDICDEKGFYIIAEANIDENSRKFSSNFIKERLIKKSFIWKNYYLDRIENLYSLFKNQTSTTIWSVGDKKKNSFCQELCYKFIKEKSNLPMQYVHNILKKNQNYDIVAEKNLTLDELKNYFVSKNKKEMINKPIFLSEYCYAKGTGPAKLEDYYNLFNTQEKFMGGCVWQFCDNSFMTSKDKERFISGKHQSSCGIFSSSRVPYIGAKNLKYVYRPLIAKLIDKNTLELFNTNYFAETNNIKLIYSVMIEGKEISRTELNATVEPRKSKTFDIFLGHIEGDMFLNLKFLNKKTGKIIATQQIEINKNLANINLETGEYISTKDYSNILTVYFENGYLRMDKMTGSVINYSVNGVEYLKSDATRKGSNCFTTNILRPKTDNDVSKKNINKIDVVLKDFDYEIKYDLDNNPISVDIIVNNIFYVNGKECYITQDMFIINSNGRLDIYTTLHPRRKKLPPLDCFGKIIKIKNEFNQIIYYGREDESYPDIKNHTPIGINIKKAKDFATNYVCAQESGNHSDVKYAIFKNLKNQGFMILALKQPFNLNIKLFSKYQLDNTIYSQDLKTNDKFFVQIDGEISGIGSKKEFPDEYSLMQRDEHIFGFSVIPFTKVNEKIMY